MKLFHLGSECPDGESGRDGGSFDGFEEKRRSQGKNYGKVVDIFMMMINVMMVTLGDFTQNQSQFSMITMI